MNDAQSEQWQNIAVVTTEAVISVGAFMMVCINGTRTFSGPGGLLGAGWMFFGIQSAIYGFARFKRSNRDRRAMCIIGVAFLSVEMLAGGLFLVNRDGQPRHPIDYLTLGPEWTMLGAAGLLLLAVDILCHKLDIPARIRRGRNSLGTRTEDTGDADVSGRVDVYIPIN